MIMDFLRAGYTAPARWRTTGDDTIMIRWYRAARGAKVYPFPHAFGSSVWDEPADMGNSGPGEIRPDFFTWAGSPPNVPAGQSTPTPAAWFAQGVPFPTPPTPSCDTHVSVSACGCGSVVFSWRSHA